MRSGIVCLFPIALLLAGGCRREPKAEVTSSPETEKRYSLRGVIRSIDAAKNEVVVAHDAIPGFMDAMTMSFSIRDDPQVIRILRPGDRIEATLVVRGSEAWIEKVLTKGFDPTAVAPVAGASTGVTPRPNVAVRVGSPVPDFSLVDQTGKTLRLSQFRGEPVAVTFLYTRCPIATACPMTTAKFSQLDGMLSRKGFGHLIVVTVDPENDTPKVLAQYAKKAGADPKRWSFVTGSPQAVADVASHFGVLYYSDRGQIIHGQAVAVVDPVGRLSTIYYGEQWAADHILRDLENARKKG
jgi:protein SCO1/2